MRIIKCLLLLLTFLYDYSYSQERPSNILTIISKNPKYTNEFVRLNELYYIPTADESGKNRYVISSIYSMDVDKDSNLYVLDFRLCTITVFDKKGKYIRTLGGKGQGPGELETPLWLSIWNDKIYVYEQFMGIKIFDLKGKYIDFNIVRNNHYNIRKFKIYNDLIYTVEKVTIEEENIAKVTYPINKISIDFDKSNTIYTVKTEYKVGSDALPRFDPRLSWTLDEKGTIYFTGDMLTTYKIDVFADNGKLILSFGREYERIPFSKTTIEVLNDFFRKKIELLKYPEVINYLIFDNGYIFVVVGETSAHVIGRYRLDSIIDVFNTKGEYLYTFKSKYFGSANTLIKNNRLYANPTDDDLNIRVFQIQYNK
jgi:hypothetical protein